MKYIQILIGSAFVIFFISCTTKVAVKKSAENPYLAEKLKDAGMRIVYKPPAGFVETGIDEAVPFKYDYALKSLTDDIEIRYVIRPFIYYKREYEALKKQPGVVLVPLSDTDYLNDLLVIVMNLSGSPDNIKTVKNFPSEAVKMEFKADWGNSTFLVLNPSYDKKYKFCTIVTLHRKNRGDAYILYLGNDVRKMTEYLMNAPLFYNLQYLD
ncbi:hypothetical protein [Leptospira santarosai]|uniref:Lipoprotein n=1 Tax=Leptospira santarosai TaxID=28183 RepID=A0AB73LM03_9LEPT|nr:hypothetical protein [Leptospira santarosai]ONF92608.1 hypothetical protein BWD14_11800 [Leptospira santarosai]